MSELRQIRHAATCLQDDCKVAAGRGTEEIAAKKRRRIETFSSAISSVPFLVDTTLQSSCTCVPQPVAVLVERCRIGETLTC